MTMTLTRCRISGMNVTRVTDFEGAVLRVVCPYFDEASRTCSIRTSALTGGPLARLLERVAENSLATLAERCELM
jgi:hypothetical protein